MRIQLAHHSAGYMGVALGVAAFAACTTFLQMPATIGGTSGGLTPSLPGVHDKKEQMRALQVMMFVHRQGAVIPTIEEGQR